MLVASLPRFLLTESKASLKSGARFAENIFQKRRAAEKMPVTKMEVLLRLVRFFVDIEPQTAETRNHITRNDGRLLWLA